MSFNPGLVHRLDATTADTDTLALSANSPTERGAAVRKVIKKTRTRLEEDEALWMLGLHYRPEPPHARRHPMYSGKVIPAQVVPDAE